MYSVQSKVILSNQNQLWRLTSRDPKSENFKNTSARQINRPKNQLICAEHKITTCLTKNILFPINRLTMNRFLGRKISDPKPLVLLLAIEMEWK